MRWSISRFSSPRQYAPATDCRATALGLIAPVDGTWGPAQRSHHSSPMR